MKKYLLLNLVPLVVCLTCLIFILHGAGDSQSGSAFSTARDPAPHGAGLHPGELSKSLGESGRNPVVQLFVQLIVVVLLARVFGAMAVKVGQPAVIGEMIAGIVLGPSLIGSAFPAASHFIFPAASMGNLKLLSQIGVVLFMFVVGMEMDIDHLRTKAQAAVLTAHIGIIFPFTLGVGTAVWLPRESGPFLPFALFVGVAMSITAFPVLARILSERNMTRTPLGVLALTCAALNDAAAWVILALVVAVAQAGTLTGAGSTLLLLAAFSALLLFVIKPLFRRFPSSWLDDGRPVSGLIVAVFIFVFACALFTESIGVHALFGAFLAGVVMPETAQFREHLRERLESFSSLFLLPIFFAFTGLRTQVGLVDGWANWGLCAVLIGIATFGKLGGSVAAARACGMGWRDAFSIGALMNTRGLVELIVLNVGYDMGILSPLIFAMMVIMALTTTCMTGPLLSWLQPPATAPEIIPQSAARPS